MTLDNLILLRPPSDERARDMALRRLGSAPDPEAVKALERLRDLGCELDGLFSASTIGEPGTAKELNRICDLLEPLWQQLRGLSEREDSRFRRADDARLV